MSIPFSNTTTRKGLIQLCEDECGFNPGDITNDATLLAKFTGYINIGVDDIWPVLIQSSGMWHIDDSNQTDYPFIFANLTSGRRDYAFTVDGSSNLILDIYRVMVASPSGVYSEIYPVDQEKTTSGQGNAEDTSSFIDGRNASGTPSRYDKTGNAIFLDVIPNYSYTNGLKVFINRESTYFVTGDTNKKPGFAGSYHIYLAIFASEMYAAMKTLANYKDLNTRKINMRRDIENYYSKRDKDTPKRLTPNIENNK